MGPVPNIASARSSYLKLSLSLWYIYGLFRHPLPVPLTIGLVMWAVPSVPLDVIPPSPWFAHGPFFIESHCWGPLNLQDSALRQGLKHLQSGSSAFSQSVKHSHILTLTNSGRTFQF